MSGRTSKMLQYVNWRMRVTISDTRTLLGTFLAYDKHMNIVLGDCDEYRSFKGKKAGDQEREEKRSLGLVLLRGENVISLTAESPPLPKPSLKGIGRGPGVGEAAGRGMAVAPLAAAPKGLAGPVRGVGGPSASVMMPQTGAPAVTTSAPVSYGRGAGGPPPPMGGRGGPPPMMFGGRGGPPPPMFGRGGPPPFMGRGRGGPQ